MDFYGKNKIQDDILLYLLVCLFAKYEPATKRVYIASHSYTSQHKADQIHAR